MSNVHIRLLHDFLKRTGAGSTIRVSQHQTAKKAGIKVLGAALLVPGRLFVVVVWSVIKSVFFLLCLQRSDHAVSASLSA